MPIALETISWASISLGILVILTAWVAWSTWRVQRSERADGHGSLMLCTTRVCVASAATKAIVVEADRRISCIRRQTSRWIVTPGLADLILVPILLGVAILVVLTAVVLLWQREE